MGRLLPFLILADIALVAMAVFDCATTEPARVRALPKGVWLLVIIVLSPFGGIAWFLNGRVPDDEPDIDRVTRADRHITAEAEAAEAADTSAPTRVVAPDDDPEFLRQLEIRVREARRLNKDLDKDQPPAEE